MIDALLDRIRIARRPVHLAAPAAGHRTDRRRRRADHRRAVRRVLHRRRAVHRPGRRRLRHARAGCRCRSSRSSPRWPMPRSPTSRWTPPSSRSGLGGTWDSTNVADAKIAVITPIGIDHTEYLGDTLTEIAGNKAGIIKPDSVAVIGPQEPGGDERHPAPDDRGGRLRRPVRQRVRRAGQGFRGRRAAAHAAGTRRRVRGHLPAAGRRAPGDERSGRAGRGGGVLRRRRQSPARHRVGAGRFRGGRLAGPAGAGPHVADDHGRRRAQSARRGRAGRPRWPRNSPSPGWSACSR